MQLHEANWILLKTIAKLNQSISSGASEQPNIKIGMKKDNDDVQSFRYGMYCKTISTLWLSV
jgi:hypothetical protein